ncbi:hypothetical protein CXB51_023918 [Gossypium anomalum]|uniref:Uncharacterized protein n=1 Tax=Gossypium anomalum TaxID=47600 RepID=A0A8J5Y7D3_9ROSI|nr:hypothetical protein CXB51_023918 [Gossypium anomalum]
MGASNSKKKRKPCHERRNVKVLMTDKMRLLQEGRVGGYYEKEVMVYACKEAEWVKERKTLKEEVKVLRKLVDEKEEKIKKMEEGGSSMVMVQKCDKGWPLLGTSYLLEQMKEERARRDEVVEKWKQLYLAIKTELDDLIQRTHGDAINWKTEEEEMIEDMKKELKRKEETIQSLKARLASMEKAGYEMKREMDILKQSFKILGSNYATISKKSSSTKLGHYL